MSKKVGVFWFDLHVKQCCKKALNSCTHFNVAHIKTLPIWTDSTRHPHHIFCKIMNSFKNVIDFCFVLPVFSMTSIKCFSLFRKKRKYRPTNMYTCPMAHVDLRVYILVGHNAHCLMDSSCFAGGNTVSKQNSKFFHCSVSTSQFFPNGQLLFCFCHQWQYLSTVASILLKQRDLELG